MLLLKNGTVVTMADVGVFEYTDVLAEEGKIRAIGRDLSSRMHLSDRKCQCIDVTGYYILPGFIDVHSHIGGTRNTGKREDNINELTAPVTAELSSYYAVNPEDPLFKHILSDGITCSCVVPGSGNVIGGTGIVLKSWGLEFKSRIIMDPAVLKAAVGLNPKAVYAAKGMAPMTRMSEAALLKSYFRKVKAYKKRKEEAGETGSEAPEFDQAMENGCLVLAKKIPLKVHAYYHDMMTVLDIAREFDFYITLDHAQGATDFLGDLQDEHVKGVIYGPVIMGLGPGEVCKADYDALRRLDDAGVLTAMDSDGPVITGKTLVYSMGEAVRMGMEPLRALAMITSNAAKILQCDDRIGSLEIGKDADILVYDKLPGRDTLAQNCMTVIDGQIVYMREGRFHVEVHA